MDTKNELYNLVSVLEHPHNGNRELIDWLESIKTSHCLLHVSSTMIDKHFVDIHYHRNQTQQLVDSQNVLHGYDKLIEFLKRNMGCEVSIYSITTDNATRLIFITDDLNQLGMLINDAKKLSEVKKLWFNYLELGYINESYHYFHNMCEGVLEEYLRN